MTSTAKFFFGGGICWKNKKDIYVCAISKGVSQWLNSLAKLRVSQRTLATCATMYRVVSE